MRYLSIALCVPCLLLLVMSVTAWAGAPVTSCDTEVMDAMESKAWLEAQRRMTQNENYVLKPDSVLEYSCFDQFLGDMALSTARKFSEETAYWGAISTNDATSLDIAIEETSLKPLIFYLATNYIHTFLGGRTVAPNTPAPAYGTYTCDAMAFVWPMARCRNFMDENDPNFVTPAYEGFYDFAFYANTEPRKFPQNLPVCTTPTNINADVTEAFNGTPEYYTLDQENPITLNPNDTNPYETDPIVTRNEMIIFGSCDESAMIPTGIDVARKDLGTVYPEFFCTIPSCSYDYNTKKCVR